MNDLYNIVDKFMFYWKSKFCGLEVFFIEIFDNIYKILIIVMYYLKN